MVLALLVIAVVVALRATVLRPGFRGRRIRWAGWAPWWYVGGQPDVPPELQEERARR